MTVLVVDDESGWLDVMVKMLVELGCTVSVADSADVALRAMVECEFDLVITDLVLHPMRGDAPMDGREVALAAERASNTTKIIVFTAYMGMSGLADLSRDGTWEVLSKLDSFDKLKSIVTALIEQNAGSHVSGM